MTSAMQIGIGLPTRIDDAAPGIGLELAARADAGPFSSLAVADRVVFRAHEPLVVLAAVVGVTRRIRLMTSALIGPTRETTLLARQAATLDALSGGRLSLGLGIGVREDDYAATGFAFGARGRRLDAQLEELRAIWAGGRGIGPPAARPEGPELLIGGYVDAVAGRIARWGDGFLAPGGGTPERMTELWRTVLDAWRAAGRRGRPRWVGASYFALGPDSVGLARAHIDSWYGFDPVLAERRLSAIPTTEAAVVRAIDRQRELGVDEFVLRPCAADLDQVDRLAELVDGLRPATRARGTREMGGR